MAQLPLTEFDPKSAVLFLGSAFSTAAINLNGRSLPAGRGLRTELANILKVDSEAYDLKALADGVFRNSELDLYDILYNLYTTKNVSKFQEETILLPWLRIYTTNYDDIIEYCYNKEKINIKDLSFSYNDSKPRKVPDRAVVHLHGKISDATPDNVLDQLVLNENSYIKQHFEKSPWYDEFIRDLRFCSACFFLGYSLSDYHIAALLMQNPATAEKTFFVTKPYPDALFSQQISGYGKIWPIGVDAFIKQVSSLPRPNANPTPFSLKTFKFFDPYKDHQSLSPPTAIEILNLILYGTFNSKRYITVSAKDDYVVPRNQKIVSAMHLMEISKCVLVHSWLGNGKTIFINMLAFKLSSIGYQCFFCYESGPNFSDEIRSLSSINKIVVFFDSYNLAVDMIPAINAVINNAKFVISIRTGVQEVRLHEIQSKLPGPMNLVNLNGLDSEDRLDFENLLGKAGANFAQMRRIVNQSKDVRDIVVALYDNSHIHERIRNDLAPLLNDRNFSYVFICIHLLKIIGQDADPAFVRSVSGVDPYIVLGRSRETVVEIIKMDDEELQARSPIFSEYLSQQIFSPDSVIDVVYNSIIESLKRKNDRKYQPVLSNLMQVSTLRRILKDDTNKASAILILFERLQRDVGVSVEPLFWLQYSILMAQESRYDAAESFLETSYSYAAKLIGFKTYQIDTHALRLLLNIETNAAQGVSVHRLSKILVMLDLVVNMIGDDSHRAYAIEVLAHVTPFVERRHRDIEKSAQNSIVYILHRAITLLSALPLEIQAQTGSRHTREIVGKAISILAA